MVQLGLTDSSILLVSMTDSDSVFLKLGIAKTRSFLSYSDSMHESESQTRDSGSVDLDRLSFSANIEENKNILECESFSKILGTDCTQKLNRKNIKFITSALR